MIAQQQKFIKQKIDLECSICLQQYNSENKHPYVICMSQHHFCLQCINTIIFKNKGPNEASECPNCRTQIFKNKANKFRFYSDMKQINQMVGKMVKKQKCYKNDIVELQTKNVSSDINYKNEKNKNQKLQVELKKQKEVNQQARVKQSKMQTQLKKIERQNYQKQQKFSQKNKTIFGLINLCEQLIIKIPNDNHEEVKDKIKKIKQNIDIQERQMFIKSRYNNPQKVNIANLIFIKTVIAISAKTTMKKPIQFLRGIIVDAFTKINQLIDQKGLFVKFQLKIMLYRNYNNTFDQLFQESQFQTKPQKIKAFLAKIDGKGDWQTQAIQVMLQKVNNLPQIDEVYLFADSQANSEKNTQNKRQFLGQKYWNKHGYPKTSFEAQLNKAKGRYPIHCIYLNKEDFFKKVSDQTKGNSKYYDIQNLQEISLIKQFICNQAINLIQKKMKSK